MTQMELGESRAVSTLVELLQDENLHWRKKELVLNDLLMRVMEWSRDSAPEDFDDSFLHSVYMQFVERRRLSEKQVQAIFRIVTKFQIE